MEPRHPILALLARGQAHGYELRSRAERDLRPFWRIDFGQLYRVLHRALRDGLIAAAGREKGAQGPARRLYRLTPRGRAAVAAWLAAPAEDDDELTVKLTLAAQGGGRLEGVVTANRGRFALRLQEAQRAYREAIDSGDRSRILACDALRRRREAVEATLALAASAGTSPRPTSSRSRSATVAGGSPAATR
ncbi:MAG: PadR family transcriptional regulator, partial [Candidatus Levyibacteriota bacterium]